MTNDNIVRFEVAVDEALANDDDEARLRELFYALDAERQARTAAATSVETDVPPVEHLVALQNRIAAEIERRRNDEARLASIKDAPPVLPDGHVPPEPKPVEHAPEPKRRPRTGWRWSTVRLPVDTPSRRRFAPQTTAPFTVEHGPRFQP